MHCNFDFDCELREWHAREVAASMNLLPISTSCTKLTTPTYAGSGNDSDTSSSPNVKAHFDSFVDSDCSSISGN